jgi:hypothetical protein
MAELPSYDLQVKAAEERRRIHETVIELRSRVHEDLDIKKVVRAQLGTICAVSAALSLGLGYLITGAFVRH